MYGHIQHERMRLRLWTQVERLLQGFEHERNMQGDYQAADLGALSAQERRILPLHE